MSEKGLFSLQFSVIVYHWGKSRQAYMLFDRALSLIKELSSWKGQEEQWCILLAGYKQLAFVYSPESPDGAWESL